MAKQRNHPKGQSRQHRTSIVVIAMLIFCTITLITIIMFIFSNSPSDDPTLWKINNIMPSLKADNGSTYDSNIPPDDPNFCEITAVNACVVNAVSGSLLFEKNMHEKIAPASTAKMLTALTVLEYCAPDDSVTVGPEITMVSSDSSIAWLYEGDVLTVRQLLIALLLPSGNDAAYVLAVHTGRRIAQDDSLTARQYIDIFIIAMNEKAQSAGTSSSIFLTPDGYDAQGQYTTAYDMSQIARACLNSTCLSEIISSYSIYEKWQCGREVTYNNTNELLNPGSTFYYPEAIGLKTGNSSEAGACLVSAAEIGGKTYICVIMGASEESRFSDTVSLYNELKK